ncbi:MAG: hypothetical protein IKR81_03065, partial [Victivallales bacterium]|nr:hypothetical protein [Victivallales bacterium]
ARGFLLGAHGSSPPAVQAAKNRKRSARPEGARCQDDAQNAANGAGASAPHPWGPGTPGSMVLETPVAQSSQVCQPQACNRRPESALESLLGVPRTTMRGPRQRLF